MSRHRIALIGLLILAACGGPKYVADGDVWVQGCKQAHGEPNRTCYLSVFVRNDGDQSDRSLIVTISAPGADCHMELNCCTALMLYPPDAKGYGSNSDGHATKRADCTALVPPWSGSGPVTPTFKATFKESEG